MIVDLVRRVSEWAGIYRVRSRRDCRHLASGDEEESNRYGGMEDGLPIDHLPNRVSTKADGLSSRLRHSSLLLHRNRQSTQGVGKESPDIHNGQGECMLTAVPRPYPICRSHRHPEYLFLVHFPGEGN